MNVMKRINEFLSFIVEHLEIKILPWKIKMLEMNGNNFIFLKFNYFKK